MSWPIDLSLRADEVAPQLLGQYLCRRYPNGQVKKYLITEVEAYVGEEDKACHSSKGRTKRTEVMYGPPGRWYVYLIYGMYFMLNLVTSPVGDPQAVLFRGVVEIEGPGRLTRRLAIDRSFNGLPANPQTGLWLEKGYLIKPSQIIALPRVGVEYAQEWKDKLLRFKLKNEVIERFQ